MMNLKSPFMVTLILGCAATAPAQRQEIGLLLGGGSTAHRNISSSSSMGGKR